jgi:hypothetical protein
MKRFFFTTLTIVFFTGICVAQPKNIRTWKGAIALLGASTEKMTAKLEAADFKEDEDETGEKDGMTYYFFLDSEEKMFIHPQEGREQFQYYSFITRDDKVVLVNFFIGPATKSEMASIHGLYTTFENEVKSAGYKLISSEKKDGDLELKIFHNQSTGIKVGAAVYTKAGKITGADINILRDNIDLLK